MRGNCLIFALVRWWTRGGYVILRKSHWGWWPHFIWSADLCEFEEFVPLRVPRARFIPPILFTGYIRQWTP